MYYFPTTFTLAVPSNRLPKRSRTAHQVWWSL